MKGINLVIFLFDVLFILLAATGSLIAFIKEKRKRQKKEKAYKKLFDAADKPSDANDDTPSPSLDDTFEQMDIEDLKKEATT